MYAPPDNQHRASAARERGRQAIAEAVQHHIDRLGPNKTKAVYSVPASRMEAAAPGAIQRAHALNKLHPNTTFFTPQQSRQAARMARHNNPLGVLGDKIEGFVGLKQTAQELAHSMDPRTRAGLANIASMFVGGPKGDATPMMGKLGMEGQFRAYGIGTGKPLDRGIANEGPGYGRSGSGIRGLVRRAQGTGRYNRPGQSPLDVLRDIEKGRAQQSEKLIQRDQVKESHNRLWGHATQFDRVNRQASNSMGGHVVPYNAGLSDRPFMDRQSHDFTSRMDLLRLQRQNPGNELFGSPEALKQALYDMLFSGKGLPKTPRRPGPRPGESPYGGGPFG